MTDPFWIAVAWLLFGAAVAPPITWALLVGVRRDRR